MAKTNQVESERTTKNTTFKYIRSILGKWINQGCMTNLLEILAVENMSDEEVLEEAKKRGIR